MVTRNVATPLLGAFLALLPLPAGAQTQPPPTRPTGVYQGDARDQQGRQWLFLSGAVSEAYDDNLVGPDAISIGVDPEGRETQGFYTRAEGRLLYGRSNSTGRVRFTSQGGVRLDYYPRLSGDIQQPIDSYDAAAGLTAPVGRGTLRLDQAIGYQPYLLLDTMTLPLPQTLFALDPTVPIAADVTLFSQPLTTYSSSAGLNMPLSRRVSLDGSFGYHGSSAAVQWAEVTDRGGTIRLNFATTRRSAVSVGYSHRMTSYDLPLGGRRDMTVREVQAAVSYRRPLSTTRSVGFEIGAGGAQLEGDTLFESGEQQQLVSYASADYQFGRTWSAGGRYQRSLQVLRGLSESFFGDTFTGSVNGTLSPRVDMTLAGTHSDGDTGFGAFSSGYNTRSGLVRVRYALSRSVALAGEYVHSQYDFGDRVELPEGVVRELKRNVVRVGLHFGVPLLR